MSSLGLIDYSLMAVGASLAVWSAGMAVSQQNTGVFSAVLVFLGTMISYGVRALFRGSKWLVLDGPLYGLAGIAAFVFGMQLQSIMPGEGFPRELFAAGWLSWMMIFGSCFGWRDSTLLFQAVPAIALFGLVGCYDTFRNVIFPFYAFLVCLATFFARAHGRQMLEESVLSGYFNRGLAPGAQPIRPETTPGLAQKLREGPWRWIAGPEWALASALVVVLISLAGAPVIQRSVQGVAGFVTVNAPRNRNSTLPPLIRGSQNSSNVTIGRGPAELTDTPVLYVRMEREHYLRSSTYDTYNGRGWSINNRVIPVSRPTAQSIAISQMERPAEFSWTIRLQQQMRLLPVPAEVIRSSLSPVMTARLDGSIELAGPTRPWQELNGVSMEPDVGTTILKAGVLPTSVGEFLSLERVDPRVINLAKTVTRNAPNDMVRAQAIQREIERRIRYNINAAAIPEDQDAVAYTLFESQEAYCDIFASSMVVMARAVGIPARYATGFLPKWENQMGDTSILVQEKDAHAWAELYFEGAGWVVFDATAGAEEVPGAGVGASSSDTAWYKPPWVGLVLDCLVVVVLGVAALLWYRAYRSRLTHPNFRTELDKDYLRFAKVLYKATHIRRGIGMTGAEYIALVTPHLGPVAPAAIATNAAFEQALYGPKEVADATLSNVRQHIRALRQELRSVPKK
jgi:hypothetical protein